MSVEKTNSGDTASSSSWEHGSDDRFTAYYAQSSLSEATRERFTALAEKILRMLPEDVAARKLEVADIGCGPGAQAAVWAQKGHAVHGVDINEPLIDIARARAAEQQLDIEYLIGSATELPWGDASMDVVLLPELLEHVADWRPCLEEAVRILKPGGLLYLSTSNTLCPVQQEFSLPLYSWYPARAKRYFEHLAVTTKPELVNHATYPAVNWFSFYGLRRELAKHGMRVIDRFEFNARTSSAGLRKAVFSTIAALPPLRFLGQVATPYTLVIGTKS